MDPGSVDLTENADEKAVCPVVQSSPSSDLESLPTLKAIQASKEDITSASDESLSPAIIWKRRIQYAAMCWCFVLEGWNDGSTGPLLPRIQETYHVREFLLLSCNSHLSNTLIRSTSQSFPYFMYSHASYVSSPDAPHHPPPHYLSPYTTNRDSSSAHFSTSTLPTVMASERYVPNMHTRLFQHARGLNTGY